MNIAHLAAALGVANKPQKNDAISSTLLTPDGFYLWGQWMDFAIRYEVAQGEEGPVDCAVRVDNAWLLRSIKIAGKRKPVAFRATFVEVPAPPSSAAEAEARRLRREAESHARAGDRLAASLREQEAVLVLAPKGMMPVYTAHASVGDTGYQCRASSPWTALMVDGPKPGAVTTYLSPADFTKGGAVAVVAPSAGTDPDKPANYAVHLGVMASVCNGHTMSRREMVAPGPEILVPLMTVRALCKLVQETSPIQLRVSVDPDGRRAAFDAVALNGARWTLIAELPDVAPPNYDAVKVHAAARTVVLEAADITTLWRPFEAGLVAVYADGGLVVWDHGDLGGERGIGCTLEQHPDEEPIAIFSRDIISKLPLPKQGPITARLVGAEVEGPTCSIGGELAMPFNTTLPPWVRAELAAIFGVAPLAAPRVAPPIADLFPVDPALKGKELEERLAAVEREKRDIERQLRGRPGDDMRIDTLLRTHRLRPTMQTSGTLYELPEVAAEPTLYSPLIQPEPEAPPMSQTTKKKKSPAGKPAKTTKAPTAAPEPTAPAAAAPAPPPSGPRRIVATLRVVGGKAHLYSPGGQFEKTYATEDLAREAASDYGWALDEPDAAAPTSVPPAPPVAAEPATSPLPAGAGRVYTIGHERIHSRDDFAGLADGLRATVVDCRRSQGTRYKGFTKQDLLARFTFGYTDHGADLGEGTVQPSGLAFIRATIATGRNVLLLGFYEAAADCHRHEGIALPLRANGVPVFHVYRNEVIEAGDLQTSLASETDYECFELAEELAEIAEAAAGAQGLAA